MNSSKSPQILLQEIARIDKMERGKLSVMREGPSGPFYKLQAREDGQNRTRYVPRDQAPLVREAIEGFQQFQSLTEQYARLIIDQTRARIACASKKNRPRPKSSSPKRPKSLS